MRSTRQPDSSHILQPMPGDHRVGPLDAPVCLVVYADFECPYCADADKSLRQVEEVYGDELLTVFRHYPLKQIHPAADLAALAAEAAGLQDKFTEMRHALFDRAAHAGLDPEGIVALAEDLGLDIEAFTADLGGHECRARVDRDIRSAESLGVRSTPSIFVNGALVRGAATFATLSRAIAGELSRREAA